MRNLDIHSIFPLAVVAGISAETKDENKSQSQNTISKLFGIQFLDRLMGRQTGSFIPEDILSNTNGQTTDTLSNLGGPQSITPS